MNEPKAIDPLISKIEAFNKKLMKIVSSSKLYPYNYPLTDMLLSKEKLDAFKEAADVGALIVGSIDGRYLIVVKDVNLNKGAHTYGFVNIDAWILCEPSFPTTDELIEWFVFNLECPILEVVPRYLVEKRLIPDNQ